MLLPILASLSFLLAGYAARKLARFGGGKNKESTEGPDGKPGKGNRGHRKRELPRSIEPNELISKVVRGVEFSRARKTISVKVGDELVEVQHPSDEIGVRPIRSTAEFARIIPREHSYSDDIFYGRLALGDTLVRQDLERQGIFEEREEDAAKELVVVQDISGSMSWGQRQGYNRIGWALRLNQELVKKCMEEGAAYLLLTYRSSPDSVVEASGPELRKALDALPSVMTAGGGTGTEIAVNSALDRVADREEVPELRMILVTDGTETGISGQTASRLREMGVHLHLILIGDRNRNIENAADRCDFLEMPRLPGQH